MLNTSRRKSRRINCRSFTDLYLPKQLFHTTSFTIHAAKQRFRATSFTIHAAKQRFRETSFTVHTVKQFFRAVCLRLHGSDCASYTLNTSRRKSRRINCRSFTDLYLRKTAVSCSELHGSCRETTVSCSELHGSCRETVFSCGVSAVTWL